MSLSVYEFFRRLFKNPKDPIIEMIMLADKLTIKELEEISDYCLALKKYIEKLG